MSCLQRVLPAVLGLLTCFAATLALAATPADPPVHDFPLGVYWPWERTEAIAKNAGMERWAFAKKTCELLKQKNVDTIWLVNIGVDDLKTLLPISRSLGLKLVPGLSEIEPKNCGGTMGLDPAAGDFHEKAKAYYERRVPEIMQMFGEDRAGVLAWVLCDEPTGVFFDLMDPIREIFAKADPERPTLAVTMWPDTPTLIAKTKLTTFCIDLYPFFGSNNPNGPHTPNASRAYYSNNLQRMVDDAGKDGRIGWVMMQCFIEIWGPREMAADGTVTALPTACIHWRTPTLAEMRWQIWEALRLGAKGTYCFVLLGEGKGDPEAKPTDMPSVQSILVKTPTPVGCDALLDPQGNATPQGNELFALYGKLAPHKALLEKLSPSPTPWVTAEGGVSIGCFADSRNGDRYVIVVNPDFEAAQSATLTAATEMRKLTNVITDSSVEVTPLGPTDGPRKTGIHLEAGSGALLKIE